MPLVMREGVWVREEYLAQDMVIVGDILLNDAYRVSLIEERVRKAKLIVDVGAHIGCFTLLLRKLNPDAIYLCVEAEPRNWEALHANVGAFAAVIGSAVSYDPRPLELWTAFTYHGCESTGGGTVAPIDAGLDPQRYMPVGTVPKVTLEALRDAHNGMRIDLLKLDCEGSEFSILGNCELDGIAFVVGEYHGRAKWDWLREVRMPDWDYGHMSQAGDLGNFHLRNPRCLG